MQRNKNTVQKTDWHLYLYLRRPDRQRPVEGSPREQEMKGKKKRRIIEIAMIRLPLQSTSAVRNHS